MKRYVLDVDYDRDGKWHEVDVHYAKSRRDAVSWFKGIIEDAKCHKRNWRVVQRDR